MKSNRIAILGQGIAGTSLWWRLRDRGITATVFDQGHHGSASAISAGVLNPITGRSFVKSWMVDELWPTARKYYARLEKEFDTALWRDIPIYRPLKNPRDENLWLSKTGLKDHVDYMSHSADVDVHGMDFNYLSIGVTDQCAVVDVAKYLALSRSKMEDIGCIVTKKIIFEDLRPAPSGWNVEDQEFDLVIYATGARQIDETIWEFMPMESCRGDLCIIKSEELSEDFLVKPDHMYIPIGDHRFWVGATFEYDHDSILPTQSGYRAILDKVDKVVDHDYETECYHVGFRPTVIDRRPLIGEHPEIKGIYSFNGLGSKGTSLSPFWSQYFVDRLLDGAELDMEVRVDRYLLKAAGQ